TIPRIRGRHEHDWLRACKGSGTPCANFGYSGPLTEMTLLGNVAKRFQGNLLKWDGPNMKVTNLAAANEWIRRPYRKGWTL
ncbi:MAG: gfo/Idh/MocA family oxidoreductase, partial [Planctomycetota bacterium]